MTRAINRVVISGDVTAKIEYAKTTKQVPVCTFILASDKHIRDGVVTTWVKVNAYGEGLVDTCRAYLRKGAYVFIEGELMNREGAAGELTEIRARELIFR